MTVQPLKEKTDTTVGVLIPTFNRAGYLKLAIESVLIQTHRALELIVIDNGSTDGTVEYVRAIPDPRLTYVVNEKNLGLAGSINKGMGLFSPSIEWCAILCDDDIFAVDAVEMLLLAQQDRDARSIVHTHKFVIDEQGAVVREALPSPSEESAVEYVTSRSRYKRETFLSGLFFPRLLFQELGGYPVFTTGLACDDALIFALALKDRLVFERRAIVLNRIHADSESQQYTDIVPYLKSMNEFRAYCDRAARENGSLTRDQRQTLTEALGRYVLRKHSTLLIKNLLAIAAMGREQYTREIPKLFTISKDDAYTFGWSAKLLVRTAQYGVALFGVRYLITCCIRSVLFVWRKVLKH